MTPRILPRTLVGRIVGGSLVAAAVASVALVVLVVSLLGLRHSIGEETHSNDTVNAALVLEGRVSTYESALHAYLLTTNRGFLVSLEQARRLLAPAHALLDALVAGDPEERVRVAGTWAEVQSYLRDYADPLVTIARIDPDAARSSVAASEAKRRSDAIDSGFSGVIGLERARASARSDSVRTDTTRAIVAAVAAAVLAVLLIVALGRWVARHVGGRLARATAAASAIATGELTVRLPEGGASELAELSRAFNGMARSLEQGRRELVAQNERLVESEQQKSELITMVSHELRTPLTSLLGFTNLLLARRFDESDQRRYLEIVHRESRRLAAIVETFLDLRSIEEGRLELQRQAFDLAQLAREQAGFLLAHAPDHTLGLDLPAQEALVLADRDRLSQVVANLISNAVKYSPAGGSVEVVVIAADDRVRLEVTDHGLGIATEDQPRVFTKFFRGQAAGHGIPGTGLGLAVAREIMEAHEGTIGFVSAPGGGSTFWIELPSHLPAARPAAQQQPPAEGEGPSLRVVGGGG
jgi:signal transduction histidine kinase